MSELKNITIILFLSVFCFIQTCQSVEVIKETRSSPNKRLFHNDRYSFEDDKILYLVCDHKVHWKCKVVQEKYPFKNTTRSCDVELAVKGEIIEPREVTTVAFGDNRAILFWGDKEYEANPSARFAIVNLDDCRKNEFEIIDSNREGIYWQLLNNKNIVTYNESFDIFFKDVYRCSYKECKLTINAEGKVIKGPIGFVSDSEDSIGDFYPVAAKSEGNGYIYTDGHHQTINLIRPNASRTELETYRGVVMTSVVEELIGICKRDSIDSEITCTQHTSNGELKFRFALNDVDNKTQLFNIYTIPERGFFLQFLEFEECRDRPESHFDGSRCTGLVGSTIMKVDANGKLVGKFEFQGFDKEAHYQGKHFWKNTEKEGYCAFMSYIRRGGDTIDLLVNCFTDADFTA